MIYVINMLIGMKSELTARGIIGEGEVNSITGGIRMKIPQKRLKLDSVM